MPRIGPIELPEFPLLLAPMEDVSDPPFRALCKKHGADLMYTEFISSEGLIRKAAKGMKKLDIFPEERPIGIQLFGSVLSSLLLGELNSIFSYFTNDTFARFVLFTLIVIFLRFRPQGLISEGMKRR